MQAKVADHCLVYVTSFANLSCRQWEAVRCQSALSCCHSRHTIYRSHHLSHPLALS